MISMNLLKKSMVLQQLQSKSLQLNMLGLALPTGMGGVVCQPLRRSMPYWLHKNKEYFQPNYYDNPRRQSTKQGKTKYNT